MRLLLYEKCASFQICVPYRRFCDFRRKCIRQRRFISLSIFYSAKPFFGNYFVVWQNTRYKQNYWISYTFAMVGCRRCIPMQSSGVSAVLPRRAHRLTASRVSPEQKQTGPDGRLQGSSGQTEITQFFRPRAKKR